MQGMRDPVVHGVMYGGQGLAKHLATKHLGAANVATLAAKNIVLDTFELQKGNEVFKNRMHWHRRHRP